MTLHDSRDAAATPPEAHARELDRLLRETDDVKEIDFLASVDVFRADDASMSTSAAPRNASMMPDAFYACERTIAMSYACVRAVHAWTRERVGEEREDVDVAACALCVNGDHVTAWNARKRRLVRHGVDDDALRRELAFVSVILSRFPKAPSAWAHRRWTLTRAALDGACDLASAFDTECCACDRAVVKKRMNYAAWSHRAWALGLLKDDWRAVERELTETETLVKRNVSDHCVMHYRSRVLLYFLNVRGDETDVRLAHEITMIRELIAKYPGHESLWCYHRFVFYEIVRRTTTRNIDYLPSTSDFIEECCDVEKTALLDPTWAEHAGASQRRFALTFQRFAALVEKNHNARLSQ